MLNEHSYTSMCCIAHEPPLCEVCPVSECSGSKGACFWSFSWCHQTIFQNRWISLTSNYIACVSNYCPFLPTFNIVIADILIFSGWWMSRGTSFGYEFNSTLLMWLNSYSLVISHLICLIYLWRAYSGFFFFYLFFYWVYNIFFMKYNTYFIHYAF